MTDPIKAVIFDMDGVITDTMPYHYRAWSKIFHDEGIPVTKYEVYKREGQKGIVSVREISSQYGKSLSSGQIKKILLKKELFFKKIVRTRFINGARSFIKMLARRNVRLALVTGTSRHEVKKIMPRKLLGLFSVIISGTEVRHGKPHPEPYFKAIKGLRIAKREGIVIENAPFGIRSAKAAGLRCFALSTSLPKRYLHEADVVFHGFPSLKTYFQDRYGL